MEVKTAMNLYDLKDDSKVDEISLALEETMQSISKQYMIPLGLLRARFRRMLNTLTNNK